jgi:hypothetical protein
VILSIFLPTYPVQVKINDYGSGADEDFRSVFSHITGSIAYLLENMLYHSDNTPSPRDIFLVMRDYIVLSDALF